MSREQGAPFWELAVASSLAQLHIRAKREKEAFEIIAPIYNRFTEGFDLTPLRSGKRLLEFHGSLS